RCGKALVPIAGISGSIADPSQIRTRPRVLDRRDVTAAMSNSTDNIIVDTATRIFRDLCEPATINDAEKGVWPKVLCDTLEESGLPLAWVPEDLGGAGATMADGFEVLRV